MSEQKEGAKPVVSGGDEAFFDGRFAGIARLYGRRALEGLRRSHVWVVGVGGVGSWAAEALARSGVGALTLVDADDLCVTNINRQLPALSSSVGRAKVEVLRERLLDINPVLRVEACAEFYTVRRGEEFFAKGEPDGVFDALDALAPKAHLLASCQRRGIAVVASGAAGGRVDPGLVQRADLAEVHHDRLLASVRRVLRQEYGFPSGEGKKRVEMGLTAIFSAESPRFPDGDGGVCEQRPVEMAGSMKCDVGYGSVTHVTATFAFHGVGWLLGELVRRGEKGGGNWG